MFKYMTVALALKLLSRSPSFYRLLGNTVGSQTRIKRGMTARYPRRVRHVFELGQRYPVQDGMHFLELGTGWVHWESLIYSLFNDIHVVLYDVWDNRQLPALKRFSQQLDATIDTLIEMSAAQQRRVHDLLHLIAVVRSFDELYRLLDWEYVVDPSGTLHGFADNMFDRVYSWTVAEHIAGHMVPDYVKDIYRILKPGGLSKHSIDPKDHLSYYTSGVSSRNYLRYSHRSWQIFFENNVQYFNRIQPSQWLSYFEDAGFELVEDFSTFQPIDPLSVHPDYGVLDQKDLECQEIHIIHRKPALPG